MTTVTNETLADMLDQLNEKIELLLSMGRVSGTLHGIPSTEDDFKHLLTQLRQLNGKADALKISPLTD